MQRAINGFGKLLVGRHAQKHIRCFDADFIIAKAMLFQQANMIERAVDHGFGTRFAILLQQMLFQRSGIDANTHRTAIIARRAHHFANTLRVANITRINPQARSTGLRRFDGPAVMKMDIGNDWHLNLLDDFCKRRGRGFIGARYAHNIGTSFFQLAYLVERCRHIRRRCIGHGLHGKRRVAAHRHLADHNLSAFASFNMSPRPEHVWPFA